ncbi:MAG: cytochrome c550 [Bacilli bacterium]
MKRNLLLPFGLIAIIGISLTIVFSYVGLNQAEQIAEEQDGGGKTEETVDVSNPEAIVKQTCASCHGQNLEGGVGPKLADVGSRLSADDIKNVIVNGQGNMPGGMLSDPAAVDAVAKWLSEQK